MMFGTADRGDLVFQLDLPPVQRDVQPSAQLGL
jgi:hypothetical protein